MYGLSELKQLHGKALTFVGKADKQFDNTIHRDKDEFYFNNIKQNHDNVMKVYPKDGMHTDAHGDQRSPINRSESHNRLQGLFFRAFDSETPSIYGTKRIIIKADDVIDKSRCKAYFADFYCVSSRALKSHYVTVVIVDSTSTKVNVNGMTAPVWCQQNLPEIQLVRITPKSCNDFFEKLQRINNVLLFTTLESDVTNVIKSLPSLEELCKLKEITEVLLELLLKRVRLNESDGREIQEKMSKINFQRGAERSIRKLIETKQQQQQQQQQQKIRDSVQTRPPMSEALSTYNVLKRRVSSDSDDKSAKKKNNGEQKLFNVFSKVSTLYERKFNFNITLF